MFSLMNCDCKENIYFSNKSVDFEIYLFHQIRCNILNCRCHKSCICTITYIKSLYYIVLDCVIINKLQWDR